MTAKMENRPHASPSGQPSSFIWSMNKIVNPLVRSILHSPLHKLMSATLLLITYRGRKTGLKYSLPVQYVQNGNFIYIMPGMPELKTWWRNLKKSAPVQLALRGQTLAGNAIVLKADTDSEEILGSLGLYLRRFPAMAKVHHIRRAADGSFSIGEMRLAATKAVIIRVEVS
jgi:deazaflavin-dependent oxidoreductase (nitroreductase family)